MAITNQGTPKLDRARSKAFVWRFDNIEVGASQAEDENEADFAFCPTGEGGGIVASKLEQYAGNRNYWFRALTKYEKRVDFKAIQGVFDKDALIVDSQIRVELRKTRDSLLKKVENADNAAQITSEFIAGLKLDTNQEVGGILGDYLLEVWRKGRDLAFDELPGIVKARVEPVKQFEKMYVFCPTGEGGGVDPTCSPSGNSDEKDSLFHGTTMKAAKSIKQQGLLISKIKGEAGIFASHDLKLALSYGAAKTLNSKSKIPLNERSVAIVKVKSPGFVKRQNAISDMGFHLEWRSTIDVPASSIQEIRLYRYGDLVKNDKIDSSGINAPFKILTETTDSLLVVLGQDDLDIFVSKDYESFDNAFGELPAAVKVKVEPVKQFEKMATYQTGLEPIDALNYFRTRALILAGIIDDELLKQAKFELLEHIKGGRPLIETIGNLRSVFEPWVGDPTKIGPSGQIGIGFPPGTMAPENILMAFRLENVIRTETTTAMSQGRLAIGDAAGEYVIGYSLSPILDQRTSAPCKKIGETEGGFILKKEDGNIVKLTPPLHYQCRTIPVFITTDDLPVEWSTQAEIDAVLRLIPSGFK